MATIFLDICNRVLRRLNEVEIASADFLSVRGIHALVKDAVRASLATMNRAEYEWPWNAAETTQLLIRGQTEYSWPVTFKSVDWNSFQLQKNEALGVDYQTLRYMERDEWYRYSRDNDSGGGSDGIAPPRAVFPSHGHGFGVTPSPDAAYTVKYRYYQNHVTLTNWDDEIRVPDAWSQVVVDGAMYHLYLFKDNPESATMAFQAFDEGLRDLQTLYINNYDHVYDTRTRRNLSTGGYRSVSSF